MTAALVAAPDLPSRRSPLRALADLLWSASRWKLAGLAALSLAGGAASAAAVALLASVLQTVGVAVRIDGASRVQAIASALPLIGRPHSVVPALMVLVIVTAAQAAINAWQARLTVAIGYDAIGRVRLTLFDAISRVEWARFGEYRTSALLEALTARVDRLGWAARSALAFGMAALTAAVYVVIACAVSIPMTLACLAAGLTLAIALRRQRAAMAALGETQSSISRGVFAAVSDALIHMKTIRAQGAEARHAAQVAALTARERAIGVRLGTAAGLARLWLDLGTVSMLALVTWLAFERYGTTAGQLLILVFVFMRLAPQFTALQQAYHGLVAELPAVSDLHATIDRCRGQAQAPGSHPMPLAFRREIRLERVAFSYAGAPTLRDVSLRIAAGEIVAIVGPSGAGKTTIADLVLGLLVPERGAVIVDDVALAPDHRDAWLAQIGYVSQDGFLFHDTIRANLEWPAATASEQDVWSALDAAGAGFVRTLPRGLETIVGERGVLLSGGERQRIVIARALLRRLALLVLDEPTSALDPDAERSLMRTLADLRGSTTVLVITHRPMVAASADRVYRLNSGRMVEEPRMELEAAHVR